MSDYEEFVDYGEVVGRGFLDKLLLAIIDANPEPASSDVAAAKRRGDRLRDARVALLGHPNSEGRPLVSDEAVLRWIGSQHFKDRAQEATAKSKGRAVPKSRSGRKLVEAAAAHFHLPENAQERLRKKWRTTCQKWFEVAMYHDDVPEALEMNLLISVQKALSKEGVLMELRRIER